ncbi:hypothetical protein CE143_08340 [Photorhabdus luminescens]|uniref:Uncharacterized protein n=1 Tax=Photorhabdus akhurstii TaxID=171438 RepID=A0ABX8LWB5_9GAMM|nr:hypothetical protein B0X70_08420 [Photorhabdus akhurstii]UJD74949.1 hypothetical protein CE143_08340 [Photorhabdus luminescens]
MSSTMFDVMQLNEEHDRDSFYSGSEFLNAVRFYRHHGFIALPDSPFTLFLPLIAVDKKGKK